MSLSTTLTGRRSDKPLLQTFLETVTGRDLDPVETHYAYHDKPTVVMGMTLPSQYNAPVGVCSATTNLRTGETAHHYERVTAPQLGHDTDYRQWLLEEVGR